MMNKESTYELQKIDCNCNDCAFLERDIPKYNTVFAEDFDNQVFFFRHKKARRIIKSRKKIRQAKTDKDKERGENSLKDALALQFSYLPQTAPINYGTCSKFGKKINFIPNTLQIETQLCFQHRRGNPLTPSQ